MAWRARRIALLRAIAMADPERAICSGRRGTVPAALLIPFPWIPCAVQQWNFNAESAEKKSENAEK
jgi:hypothetical protein